MIMMTLFDCAEWRRPNFDDAKEPRLAKSVWQRGDNFNVLTLADCQDQIRVMKLEPIQN
jgi:hypothetical protein